MKPELKIIISGMVLCLTGAILLDIGIQVTGVTLIWLGGFAIIMAPLVMTL